MSDEAYNENNFKFFIQVFIKNENKEEKLKNDISVIFYHQTTPKI